jgi:hypothetical protein
MNTRLADALTFSLAYGPSVSQGNRLSETDKRRLYEQNSRLSEEEQELLYGNPLAHQHQPMTQTTPITSPRQPRRRMVPAPVRALLASMLRTASLPA